VKTLAKSRTTTIFQNNEFMRQKSKWSAGVKTQDVEGFHATSYDGALMKVRSDEGLCR
jgi:hypothetical protein